jgi:uncharacterized protein (DUF1778 family)
MKKPSRQAKGGTPMAPEYTGLLIRRFPKDVRQKMKAAAALEGKLLKDWVVEKLGEAADRVLKRTR